MRETVAGFLRELQAHLPDTELCLIVGMAAGADILVVEAGLELGIRVEAVLPMPLEQYAADFDSATLAHLRELLREPGVSCVELSCNAPAVGAVHSPEERDSMYANLSDTLIRRSSLLLALWDGQATRLKGGTAYTVLRFLGVRTEENRGAETVELVASDEEPDVAAPLVYWAPTVRQGSPPATPGLPPCYLSGVGDNVLQMHSAMPLTLKHQLAELNGYNVEFEHLSAGGELGAQDSLLASLPDPGSAADNCMLEDIDTQYGKADALAVYYQRRSDRLFGMFGVMAGAMGLAYLIYDKLTQSRLLLIAYLLMLLSGLGLYQLLQGKRWFGKHLTYRALAETLRARFYLRLAGADHRVDAGEVLALSGIDHFHGFSWIGCVLKGIEPTDIRMLAERELDARDASGVEHAWIQSQHRYFTRKVAHLERSSLRVKRLKQTLLVAILLVISALYLFGEILDKVNVGRGITLPNLLTFAMGMVGVLLAVWELHQDKMATRELLWQYRNQLSHFSRAKAQLTCATSPHRRNEILAELGKDSLMESYLWAIHRYHREHEPPAA